MSTQRNDNGWKAYEADAVLTLYDRVKLDADGKITQAGLTDPEIGTLQTVAANAAGEVVPVKLRTAPGTHKMRAKEAITLGDLIYTEAAGEVQDTAADGSILIGECLTTSGAENDIVEVLYNAHGDVALSNVYIPDAASQAISDAGAANVTAFYTAWTTTGAAAGTLADGVVVGQLKKIQLIVDVGDLTLTPATLQGGTTIVFADAGDYALLRWATAGWRAIELGNDADGATAPVLA